MLDHLLDVGAAGERHAPAQHLVQRAAERVDVGPGVDGVRVFGLFGGHVIGRADDDARPGELPVPGPTGEPRQTEVQHFELPFRGQHQVLRLDVAVNHPVLVRVLEPVRRLPREVARDVDRQRPLALEVLRECHPLHVFHDEEVHPAGFVGVERLNDVRVAEAGGGAHLVQEPGQGRVAVQQVRVNHLERDLAAHAHLLGKVHGAHAAFAEYLEHAVPRVPTQLRRHAGRLHLRHRGAPQRAGASGLGVARASGGEVGGGRELRDGRRGSAQKGVEVAPAVRAHDEVAVDRVGLVRRQFVCRVRSENARRGVRQKEGHGV